MIHTNIFRYVIYILLINLHNIFNVTASSHSVLTYKKASLVLNQLVTSSTLQWEPYKATIEYKPKQLEFAVQGSIFKTEEEHYPVYICRGYIEGVYRFGYTEKKGQKHVCLVSHVSKTKPYLQFDILVNKGKLGKVAWRQWKRYGDTPMGAVSVNEYTYVARHRVKGEEKQDGSEYNLGRLEVSQGSNIKVFITDMGGNEQTFQECEVLCEVEPYKYELSSIELDKIRMDVKINTTELASTILSNTDDTPGAVKSLLQYEYDIVQFWGTHDGLVRTLPTKIFETGILKPVEINWALRSVKKQSETKEVSSYLHPGTAINVTLVGNVSTIEAPYTARLMTYYPDVEKISSKISSTVYKKLLTAVRLEFSPVYWIENGTLLPTTTTTTTTTTESVKHVTNSANPISVPPTVIMTDANTSPKSETPSIESNEVSEDEVTKQNYAENLQDHSLNLSHNSATTGSQVRISLGAVLSTVILVLSSTYLNC